MDESANYDFKKRTKAFALGIIRLYASLPKHIVEVQVCGKQLLRSGTSVAANYREAYRARSTAEFISKLEQCLQEADESQLWLELLKEGCSPKAKAKGVADRLSSVIVHILSFE